MSKITNDGGLKPVWPRMLYSSTHMATVGVKGLTRMRLNALVRHEIIIIIIIIQGQCLWCCHHAVAALREFTLVHAESAARRQVAADIGPSRSARTISPPVGCRLTTLTIAILLLGYSARKLTVILPSHGG